MNRQTKQYHAFLYIFLPSLHDYHKKSPSVPEVIRAAFVNSLLAAASLLTDSGNFLRVAATPLVVFESSDPVLEPLWAAAAKFVHVVATRLAAYENFVPVPEVLLSASVDSLHIVASPWIASGSFLYVAENTPKFFWMLMLLPVDLAFLLKK